MHNEKGLSLGYFQDIFLNVIFSCTLCLGLPSTKRTLPASVLATAPHFAELSIASAADPHLKSTQKLVLIFSPQAIQDTLVSKVLFASVHIPLP